MKENYELDNLTGQEIKEMIDCHVLNFEKLDASALRKLMDYEIDLLCVGEGDAELISKCSDRLDEIDPNPMSSEAFKSIIERNNAERITVLDGAASCIDTPKPRFILKRIAVIAAAIAIVMTATVAIAGAFGINLFDELNKLTRMEEGTKYDLDGVTFYHNGETKVYSSVEELIKAEDWDIMYPTKFPEGVVVESIETYINEFNNTEVLFYVKDRKATFSVERNAKEPIGDMFGCSEYEKDGVTYYIFEEDGVYAVCYYNNDCYYISAENYEDLIFIIDNIKE